MSFALRMMQAASLSLNCSKLRKLTKDNVTPILLVGCGSFSPLTYMHLRLFEMARDTVEETGLYEVIGGFLSPVADAYGKKDLLPINHRMEMCRDSVKSSDWLEVDDWEGLQDNWTVTRAVLEHFENRINSKEILDKYTKGKAVRIMFVSGGDLVESFAVPDLWTASDVDKIVGYYGIVITERSGVNAIQLIEKSEHLKKYRDKVLIVQSVNQNNLSSTIIRRLVREGKSIKYLVPDPVRDHILKHGLFLEKKK